MRFSFKLNPFDFKLIFTDDRKVAERYVQTDQFGDCICFEPQETPELLIYINFDEYKRDVYSHGFLQALVHETNHAAITTLTRCGVVIDHQNQEVLCYLQDFIFRTILDKLGK